MSFRMSLLLVLPLTSVAAAVLVRVARHSMFGRRALIGLIAGAAATVAYDLVRLALQVLHLVREPFRAIALYGQSLLPGSHLGSAAGWAYHAWNGLTFAMFFAIAVRRITVWKSIGWALLLDGLQTLTITEVPGLAVGREFLTASIVGHLAYGAVLGLATGRALTGSKRNEE
jgi:hypothetical protein